MYYNHMSNSNKIYLQAFIKIHNYTPNLLDLVSKKGNGQFLDAEKSIHLANISLSNIHTAIEYDISGPFVKHLSPNQLLSGNLTYKIASSMIDINFTVGAQNYLNATVSNNAYRVDPLRFSSESSMPAPNFLKYNYYGNLYIYPNT